MKKHSIYRHIILAGLFFISSYAIAQVGINTTDPKGILDFNSTTHGVVYPNVALVATDDPSPVVNPQGGAIVPGTVVYNTNTTYNGTVTDVYPGIYTWDGSEWVVHYKKRQSELYEQTSVLRTEADYAGEWQDVPGLGIADNNTFTAKYSGLYRIEMKTNFAGGQTDTNSEIFVSQAKGQFRFLFDGTPYTFETTAFSAYSSYINSGTHYEGIWKESYKTVYLTLTAGTTYPFSLCFDAYDAPGFVANGTTTIQSSVDLINEDFDPTYTVAQSVSSSGCAPNGWTVSTSNPCSSCVNNSLYINSDSPGCSQNATAYMNFTPTVSSVSVNFDYLFRERSGRNDSFRVYLRNESTLATTNLLTIANSGNATTDASYSGSATVVPGTTYTLRFEYISDRAYYASVDNVNVSELSGPITTVYEGRGYVGNEVNCQIEFTYIGE